MKSVLMGTGIRLHDFEYNCPGVVLEPHAAIAEGADGKKMKWPLPRSTSSWVLRELDIPNRGKRR